MYGVWNYPLESWDISHVERNYLQATSSAKELGKIPGSQIDLNTLEVQQCQIPEGVWMATAVLSR
jgi:hypothetical protein